MSAQSSRVAFVCIQCGKDFQLFPSAARRGRGRFCDRRCGEAYRTRPLAERFRAGIGRTTPEGCVLWGKSVKSGWHGQIAIGGSSRRKGFRMLVASRVAWELAHGPIPDGLSILHSCDNPACVNVEHLFLGTQTDNVADMVAKGRQAKGESLPQARLNADAVREIRRRASLGECQRTISKDFEVSFATVCLIVSRKRWVHVV
jgi:hypothetical protein